MNCISRLFTLAALSAAACLAVACDADQITSQRRDIAFSRGPALMPAGFARCEAQPYASSSARIGPNGGTLRTGRHTLRIPPGALKKAVLITMESPSDTLNYVVFGPEGLTFDELNAPTLVMSYRNCMVADHENEAVDIVYVDDSLTAVLETTESISADTVNKTVGARLRHFSTYVLRKSRYAVAY